MKIRPNRTSLSWLAILLLAAAGTASAQNIYKCTSGGKLVYQDQPCPRGTGEILHEADDTEIIDRYLRLGQDHLAKSYADSHQLQALYEQRLEAQQDAQDERARRQADEAYAAEQRAYEQRQQALYDEAIERERLQSENEALRQQNEAYENELNQPVYIPETVYMAPYPNRRPRHDHDHEGHDRPRPPREPVFHPCKQLAGGRTQC